MSFENRQRALDKVVTLDNIYGTISAEQFELNGLTLERIWGEKEFDGTLSFTQNGKVSAKFSREGEYGPISKGFGWQTVMFAQPTTCGQRRMFWWP